MTDVAACPAPPTVSWNLPTDSLPRNTHHVQASVQCIWRMEYPLYSMKTILFFFMFEDSLETSEMGKENNVFLI
jgi:hypothetical protein